MGSAVILPRSEKEKEWNREGENGSSGAYLKRKICWEVS